MLGTGFNTFTAKGAFFVIKLGDGFLLIPLDSFIFTGVKALSAVDTTEATFLSTRDVLQRFITTQKGNLGFG